MRLPDFDFSKAQWDRYRRFHVHLTPWLVQFETGEAIITRANHRPYDRGHVHNTDLAVWSTADHLCPKLMLDPNAHDADAVREALEGINQNPDKIYSKAVPASWLQVRGSQLLLEDKAERRVVALDAAGIWDDRTHAAIPKEFQRTRGYHNKCVAYIPGPDSHAVGARIKLSVPVRMTKEERRAANALRSACSAWCEMVDWSHRTVAPDYYKFDSRIGNYTYARPFDIANTATLPGKYATPMEDLSGERRFQIGYHGFQARREIITTLHLKTITQGEKS